MNWILPAAHINDNTGPSAAAYFRSRIAELTISDCKIQRNEAYRSVTYQTDPNDPNTVVTDDSFIGEGGGIYAFASLKTIEHCQINYNISNTSGGGIYVGGEIGNANVLLIKNCLIAKNQSSRDGAGLSINWFSTVDINNCTVADNSVYSA